YSVLSPRALSYTQPAHDPPCAHRISLPYHAAAPTQTDTLSLHDALPIFPTHKEVQRIDRQDLVYKHERAKFAAVVEDVVERHENKQPVLIGTTSVEKSEYVSKLLAKEGIRHEVLNAKNYAREA